MKRCFLSLNPNPSNNNALGLKDASAVISKLQVFDELGLRLKKKSNSLTSSIFETFTVLIR